MVLPIGHTGAVVNICMSPDGKRIVTTSLDFTAKLWDAQTGKLLVTMDEHKNFVTSAAYSSDGNKILTASYDKTARIWDARTGKLLVAIEDKKAGVQTARFSPDGNRIVTAPSSVHGKMAKIWDAATGKVLLSLEGHTDHVYLASFSPDGNRVLTASEDETVRIWDSKNGQLLYMFKQKSRRYTDGIGFLSPDLNTTATLSPDGNLCAVLGYKEVGLWDLRNGQLLYTLEGQTDEIYSAMFSPDGKRLITTSRDDTARVWDLKSGQLQFKLQGQKYAAFSPDGNLVITIGFPTSVWDAHTGKLLFQLEGHSNYREHYAIFSPHGKRIVTASLDGTAKIWDIVNGKLVLTLKGQTSKVYDAKFSPKGDFIVSAHGDKTAKIWDIKIGKILYSLKGHRDEVYFSVFSPDQKHIITYSLFGNANLWDTKNAELIQGVETNTGVFDLRFNPPVAFKPDGTYILLPKRDSIFQLWNLKNGKLLLTFDGLLKGTAPASMSPDYKTVATVSSRSILKLWEVDNGKLLQTIEDKSDGFTNVMFSPDGSRILTTPELFESKTAKVWDTKTGALILKLKGHSNHVTYGIFSPDGSRVITSAMDKTVRIWNAQTGELLHTLQINAQFLSSATFSLDGNKIVTTTWPYNTGKAIQVWNIQTGKLLFDLKGHVNYVKSCDFSPDGKFLITSSWDNTLKMWDVETGKLVYTFLAVDSSDYFFQIPSGYYLCSPNGAKNLHYITKDLRVITFEQLDIKYNRPDLVLRAIGNKDTGLINSYQRAYYKRIKKLGIDTASFRDDYSVPEADFKNRDSIAYEQTNKTLQLNIKGFDSTYKLDRFNVWVNEVPLFGQKGISVRWRSSHSFDTTIVVDLSVHENRIETSVVNVNGTESYRMPLYVRYTPVQPVKETVYFIGIGIDEFADTKHNLQWCVKDIQDLALKFKEKYPGIIIDTIFNQSVNLERIRSIKKRLLRSGIHDKVIVAYSGHGLLSREYDYYLSSYDVNFKNPAENGIPYEAIEELLDSIPARKKLLLLDACHSGEVDKEDMLAVEDNKLKSGNRGLLINRGSGEENLIPDNVVGLQNSFELMQALFVNVAKGTGTTVITAAGGVQFAQERGDLQNGVFTFSILELLQQQPTIKVSELKQKIGERVLQLTNGLQKPTTRNDLKEVDWYVW